MFISNLKRLFTKTPAPTKPAPQRVAETTTHSYSTENGRTEVRATSVDQFYASKDKSSEAQNALSNMERAMNLSKQDNVGDDLDDREGHVVLLQENFEAHQGQIQWAPKEGVKVWNEGETLKTTDNRYSFSSSDSTLNADGTLTLELTENRIVRPAESEKTAEPLRQSEHGLGNDGRVKAPGARSLTEARTLEQKSTDANRAQILLDETEAWTTYAKSMDNSEADLDPREGHVALVEMAVGSLKKEPALQFAALLSGTVLWHDSDGMYGESAPVETLALQSGPEGTSVIGAPDHGGDRPFFKTSSNEAGVDASFHSGGWTDVESIKVNAATRSLDYQISDR